MIDDFKAQVLNFRELLKNYAEAELTDPNYSKRIISAQELLNMKPYKPTEDAMQVCESYLQSLSDENQAYLMCAMYCGRSLLEGDQWKRSEIQTVESIADALYIDTDDAAETIMGKRGSALLEYFNEFCRFAYGK